MKLAASFFVLVACIFSAHSQRACTSTDRCYDTCQSNSENDNCCLLEIPTNPNPDDYPLDYQLYFLPGTDSDLPNPCVRITFTTAEVNAGNVFYVIVPVETQNTRLCLRSNMNNNPVCGSGPFFYCMMVPVTASSRSVDLELFCDNSCEVSDSSFFLKAARIVLENEDEYLCENNATAAVYPLPSSLDSVLVANQPRTTSLTLGAPTIYLSQTALFLALLVFLVKQFLL